MAGVLLGGLPVGHIGTPMFIAIGALDVLDVGTAFATLLRRQVFAPPRTQAH
jgi:hypothetical protein